MHDMNKLSQEARAQILTLLCEGVSIRAITRITGAGKNTVTRLLVDAGQACVGYQDRVLRNLPGQRLQVDEIWSFIYTKRDNLKHAKAAPVDAGDAYTWTAICADTKLLVSFYIGDRGYGAAKVFIDDLKERLTSRIQLTSDGHKSYVMAVAQAFGDKALANALVSKRL
jgi:hypothetical protein